MFEPLHRLLPTATCSRREMLRRCGLGLFGLSLPQFLAAPRSAAATGVGRAKSCIVLFCWGGTSHIDTWDPKPDGPAEIRGEFSPIATATPGIRFSEHMPLLARQSERLAVVRSVHHRSSAHGKGMYWNMTGHPPAQAEVAVNQPPTPHDWPNLGSMIARLRQAPRGFPGAVQLPYPLVDNGTLQSGDGPGWLGQSSAPVLLRPGRGKPYGGVSRDLGAPVLNLADDVDANRFRERQSLIQVLDRPLSDSARIKNFEHYQQMAFSMLMDPRVQATLDLEREDPRVRDAYGDHICGQSCLLARRLVEARVPLVTVVCAAGDLNGSAGDHWDTHGDNFNRLKRDLLPPMERASSALLKDLDDRGLLDETLVVWLTEFGRTPKISGNGRDHYPLCYSVAFAGGGIRGGQVYGRSDRRGAEPAELACGPNDLHATIFQALGIPLDSHLQDNLGRPLAITDGQPLPLF